MAADNILRTYGDSSIKEDVVLNSIEYLTATETQVFNMLGKTTAIATVHSYLTDTLATAASLAVAEGADYTATALTTPTRLTNLVEIVAKNYKVTDTQKTVSHYTGEDELARQTTKALKDWGNAAEFDLVRSTLVSGVSGTIPKMSKLAKMFLMMYNGYICLKLILAKSVQKLFLDTTQNGAENVISKSLSRIFPHLLSKKEKMLEKNIRIGRGECGSGPEGRFSREMTIHVRFAS